MLLALQYQVMVQAGSLENTLEARVTLGHRLEQLSVLLLCSPNFACVP